MADTKDFSKSNNRLTALFIIWCIVLYVIFYGGESITLEKLNIAFKNASLKDGIIIAMMPLIVIIFSWIIKPGIKSKLVFWRIKNELPGCRSFSKLAPNDFRIDMEILKSKLGQIPSNPREQNTTWYKIFKQYSGSLTIWRSHKNFILTRDLASISIISCVIGTFGLIMKGLGTSFIISYSIIMLIHYLVFALVARNVGNRLVCNVLAEYTVE